MDTITLTADTILETLAQHRDDLIALGVKRLGLFGSYVRGEQTPDSDIDLLVTLEPVTYRVYMNVWDYLEELFQSNVDLVIEKSLKAGLRPTVMREVRYVEKL